MKREEAARWLASAWNDTATAESMLLTLTASEPEPVGSERAMDRGDSTLPPGVEWRRDTATNISHPDPATLPLRGELEIAEAIKDEWDNRQSWEGVKMSEWALIAARAVLSRGVAFDVEKAASEAESWFDDIVRDVVNGQRNGIEWHAVAEAILRAGTGR